MSQHEVDRRRLVLLIWTYLALLIIEGALRKWALPSLSDPLLLVRDPVAIAIGVLGFRSRYLVFDIHVRTLFILLAGFVAIGAIQLINGVGGSPLVIGYGLRTYLLHLPVAFVMARALEPRDLRRILVAFLWLALPMAILMALQFQSNPTARINAGVAGHSGQIISDKGHIRPAGTFSYIDGPIGFFGITMAALVAAYVDIPNLSWILRISAWLGVTLAVSVSGSRSFLAALVGVLFAGAAGWARGRSFRLSRGLVTAAVTAVIVANVLGSLDTVQEGTDVMQSRLSHLSNGGLSSRLMGDYYSLQWALLESPPMGVGLGAGTNAGAALLGTRGFRWGEGEWARVIFEAGPLLGLLYLAWRIWLTIVVARAALRAAATGVILPIVLFGACATNLISGQWGQTTIQGFAVFTLGLSLAAGRAAASRARLPVAYRRHVPPPHVARVAYR
jgi:hypothetical protein